jgi:ariadne-1
LEKKLDKAELKKKIECPICLENIRGTETYALGCGHRYCNKCWRNYLELKVKSEADCVCSHCPFPKCTEVVHDRAFKKILPKDVFKSYEKFVFRSLVSENPSLKFCPAPGCSNAIRVDRKNRREAVKCTCGFRWCFQCADYENGDHMPATCENVDAWKQKATDESENVRWLIANTKKCPTCRKPIEKNGGCMHMTCRKQSGGCGAEFCWLCRGPWTEHGSETGGYYACNKYDASKAKVADDKASSVKTELEAYMFYYHRYESHHSAMKIADEQRRNAERKSSDILDLFQVRAQDTQFLKEATEQLLDDRRVLKWSYVYGFYLDKSNNKERNLFEYLQEDLEKHTNKLSELYEIPLTKLKNDYHKFVQWKEQVTNYTRVTAGFLSKFVEGVSKGLTDESG